ncbi:glycosyltransferase family 2 protein [Deefgea sp. CFH1-16]|uniref:glycosyltransferase family 2 protein n=1 Tax=Deefgea sp. CFH1-16 TaxID=2675457 RepID=UPI0015F39C4A|nr:glycosyltransferase family 2 protein [Deefgea sp. CFH1-16]MBM5574540.1 glycosyltransferase [Deefgea sp. CFH1-16]
MKISIIVTTYNRPKALNLVLAGLARQKTTSPIEWEVLIADDGSKNDTFALIQSWQSHFPCALHHVWHEDLGFRAGAIRNRAAAQSQGDYLVFLDGDCVPMPDFLQQHAMLVETTWYVAGNRILLSEAFTATLLEQPDAINIMDWSIWQWFTAKLSGKTNRAWPCLRLKLADARKKRRTRWEVVKSCNLGVWRADFIAINGFDESFSGWGHEDSDFAIRLLRLGVGIKDGRFAVPVLHLWHRENDRSKQAENWKKLEETLKSTHIEAKIGLKSLTQ